MTDKIKIKVYCTTGYVGSDYVEYVEEDRETWESMSEEEQAEELNNYAWDFMSNHIDYGAYVVEDEGK